MDSHATTSRQGPVVGARALAPVLAQRALDLAPLVAVAERAPLVGEVLAPGERDLELGVWPLEVDTRGDERQPLLRCLADQALDLAAVEQKLAGALRVVVLARGRRVGRDVHVVHPDLSVAERRVGVLELAR